MIEMSHKVIIKKKVKCAIATGVAIASIFVSSHLINHAILYGAVIDDYSEPDHVYEKDDCVPEGYFNEHPIKVAVSHRFSDKEFSEIERGIKELDKCAKGMKFEIVKTYINGKRNGEQIIILKDIYDKYTTGGIYGISYFNTSISKPKDYKGTIYLNKNLSINLVFKTTIHEIEHVFGFQHERDHTSIMFHKAGYYSTPLTQKDIEKINKKFPAKSTNKDYDVEPYEEPFEIIHVKPFEDELTFYNP